MRGRLLTVATALLVACGLDVTGTDSSSSATNAPATPAETRTESFTCGAVTCSSVSQVCCRDGETFVCRDGAAGCSADGSVAGAPPLHCTTYNACPNDSECCYSARDGATCKARCDVGEARLCIVDRDGCGDEAECRAQRDPPAPGVGTCQRDEGGGGGPPGGGGGPPGGGGGPPGGGGGPRGDDGFGVEQAQQP